MATEIVLSPEDADKFKDHKASIDTDAKTTIISYSKGSSAFRIDYILYQNKLVVTGDWDTAVFMLTEEATLKSLATEYELDYLMGKCICSSRPANKKNLFVFRFYLYGLQQAYKQSLEVNT
jgi:hypothetical protein